MAKLLQTDPTSIETRDGRRIPRRCHIEAVSFSAHCDFLQTSEFIDLVKPTHIVLVHGEKNQMARLQDALLRKYNAAEHIANKRRVIFFFFFFFFFFLLLLLQAQGKDPANTLLWKPSSIHGPENCFSVDIPFPAQGKVRVVGDLAEMVPGIDHQVQGLLVRRDFDSTMLKPEGTKI
jgi:cleavage and polyadenylation specificity factor subunit 3